MRNFTVCVLFMLVSTAFLFPVPANAVTWPADSPRLSIELGFHKTYSAGVSHTLFTHSGLDATASAGSQIFSPLAATVSFAGSIPSGDSSLEGGGVGQTTQGVSLALEDGRTLALLPFESVYVEEGDHVTEGQVLGTLAASGDRSSQKPHLHIGLKRGRTYYDPAVLFGAQGGNKTGGLQHQPESAIAGGAHEAIPEPDPVPNTAEQPASVQDAPPYSPLSDVLQLTRDRAGQADAEGEKSHASTEQPAAEQYGHVTSGSVESGLAAKEDTSAPAEALRAVSGSFEACRMQGALLLDALLEGIRQGNAAYAAAFMFLAVALVAAAAALVMLVRRAVVPHVANLWRKLRIVLVRTGAG